MPDNGNGGWLRSVVGSVTSAAKTAWRGIKKVARFFAKAVTGTVHYAVRAIEFALRFAVRVVKFALIAVAVVVVALVLLIVVAAIAVLMTAYKIVQGVGLLLRSPYHLTRPNGANGVKTDFQLYAKSWRPKYFQCMTPGAVLRRERELETQEEFATAWRLINEASNGFKEAFDKASKPSYGIFPEAGIA